MALGDDLVSYWALDEASGTRADSHASNDLSDVNTVGSATGLIGNEASFVAANSEALTIADGSQAGLDPLSGDFSISVWIKPTADALAAAVSTIVQKGAGDGATPGYWAWIGTFADPDVCRLSVGDGTNRLNVDIPIASFAAGVRAHLVWTCDRDGNATAYLNGSSVATTDISSINGSIDTSDAFSLGRYVGDAFYFDGGIDEVGYWSRVLDGSEVTDLYNSGSGRDYAYITGGGGNRRRRLICGVAA